MTLILSVLTRDSVYQASDRRFVWVRGDKIVDRKDYENKAVVWCMRLAFAFTGLAELGTDGRTDLWLAKTLADIHGDPGPVPSQRDQSWLLDQLAERATAEFRTRAIQKIPASTRRHAFVGVGWAKFNGAPLFTPYRALVSNFHGADPSDDTRLVELPEAQRTFATAVRRLGETEDGLVEAFPSALRPERARALIDELSQADASAAGPAAMTRILGAEIRRTSRFNRYVGRGLLVNVIPRAAVESPSPFLLLGPPERDHATFLYVPAQSWEVRAYGPTTVCEDRITSGFTAGPPDN